MSQPQCDHGDVDARLKQRHRRTMPNDVRRHSLLLQSGATGGCPVDRFPQQQMDSKSRQRFSTNARECARLLWLSQLAKPVPQNPRGPGPERYRAILSTLPMQLNIALRAEGDMALAKAGDL